MKRLAWILLSATTAHALTQANGTPIPAPPGCTNNQPDGLASIFACQCVTIGVCNIGAPCTSMTSCDDGKHGTCETTLYHSFNDNTCIPSNLSGLDPKADASLSPNTFTPTCGLTFTLLSRGTARFQNLFGWYNVTGAVPAATDLHPMLDCHAAAGAQVMLDVKSDPAYKGGAIGFFLATPEDNTLSGQCAGGDCCATVTRASSGQGRIYYSESQFNPDHASTNPFIHLLVYDSKLQAQKFYFAWEDTFQTSSANFTDLVASVSGVQCSAAGTACDTGMKGQCARGLTACDHGAVSCDKLTQPASEICNGLDDDCNGLVDDGAQCPSGLVCAGGQCVNHCTLSAEFSCLAPFACDSASGLCLDPKCAGVSCPDGKVCRGGSCVGPCDGITCPHGSECNQGACVDPCAKVTCPSGQICVEGICLAGCAQCGGITCAAGLSCDSPSGACVDRSCPSCPSGTWCDQGTCKDKCDGAVCPPGQTCAGGACTTIVSAAADGGTTISDDPDGGIVLHRPPREAGCGCHVGGGAPAGGVWLLLLFALPLLRRSRRS
jgi:MYXO-CTERM domain-containing protein